MNKPNFYCTQYIDNHSNLPKYQPADCKQQCSACMDEIIDHHFNKKKTEPLPVVVIDDTWLEEVSEIDVKEFKTLFKTPNR